MTHHKPTLQDYVGVAAREKRGVLLSEADLEVVAELALTEDPEPYFVGTPQQQLRLFGSERPYHLLPHGFERACMSCLRVWNYCHCTYGQSQRSMREQAT